MKSQMNVIIITGLLILAVGFIVNLSGTPGGLEPVHKALATENTITVSQAELDNVGKPNPERDNPFQFVNPLPVGTPAPDFRLQTASGDPVKLSSFKGKKNVVLIFYQGSFCTVCAMQLSNLQSHAQDFADQNAEIIAISADDLTHAQKTLGNLGLSFPVAADPARDVINRYGVRNTAKNIAWPAACVVDKKGIIRMSFAQADMKRIHANELLPALSKLTGKPAPVLTYYE